MRELKFFVLVLWVITASCAWGQELNKRLTNQSIIDMASMGLSDDVIIAKIRSASGTDELKFDTSIDGLKALKAGNVSDAVIKVMINPAPPPGPVIAAASAISLDPNLPPPEVGVYWKNGAAFILIQGQAIAQAKAGGRAASYFTYGIRGQHWDATLNGATSNNVVKDRRPLFYFYVPEGTDATDYLLIKLEKKSDRREFQVGSFGGIGGGKSGVKKEKEVSFKSEHVGIRIYKITVESELKPGEYAFFMGTGTQANMSAGRVSSSSGGSAAGRVYDFSIPE
ncbi:MAG: hypothetical protein WAK48_01150 [Candidatus Acidiferrum sp.]|jgi:hypothetical protein